MRRRANPRGLRIVAAGLILAATAFWILIGAYFEGHFDWVNSLTTAVIGVVLAALWLTLPDRKQRRH